MKYIATFDIGTTGVKGVIVNTDGEIVYSDSREITTIFKNEFKEQDPKQWYTLFIEISKDFFDCGFCKEDVLGIIMSGQMQDLILVDERIEPLHRAILYSDGRASQEAKTIIDKIGLEKVINSTGNNFDGSMPFAKLLWFKNHHKEIYDRINKILISSKDYCISKLTGEFLTDVTSASTAGLMNIKTKEWNKDWCEEVGIDPCKLPDIKYCHEIAGTVSKVAALESGYAVNTPVYVGTGDAGATTLASGISKKNEFNINIGTSGWVASISEGILEREGVFNLAAIPKDLYINVVPFLNAGNVHNWISSIISSYDGKGKYKGISEILEGSTAGSNGLLFLPYIVGERFPVMDTEIKGSYYGITPNIAIEDMVRSTLEGVAFSIKQGIEQMGKIPEKITLIGGGAKEKNWCQIFADVLEKEIYVNNHSEYLPAIAIASAVLLDKKVISNYADFINKISQSKDVIIYKPNEKNFENYNRLYNRFKKLYPCLKGITKSE